MVRKSAIHKAYKFERKSNNRNSSKIFQTTKKSRKIVARYKQNKNFKLRQLYWSPKFANFGFEWQRYFRSASQSLCWFQEFKKIVPANEQFDDNSFRFFRPSHSVEDSFSSRQQNKCNWWKIYWQYGSLNSRFVK